MKSYIITLKSNPKLETISFDMKYQVRLTEKTLNTVELCSPLSQYVSKYTYENCILLQDICLHLQILHSLLVT